MSLQAALPCCCADLFAKRELHSACPPLLHTSALPSPCMLLPESTHLCCPSLLTCAEINCSPAKSLPLCEKSRSQEEEEAAVFNAQPSEYTPILPCFLNLPCPHLPFIHLLRRCGCVFNQVLIQTCFAMLPCLAMSPPTLHPSPESLWLCLQSSLQTTFVSSAQVFVVQG